MNEQLRPSQQRLEYFTEDVVRMYNIASGGLGVHLHAVTAFVEGKPLEKWARDSLSDFKSNYLVYPYIFYWLSGENWQKQKPDDEDGPTILCSRSANHVSLIKATKGEYHSLQEEAMRILAGANSNPTQSPDCLISSEVDLEKVLLETLRDKTLSAAVHKLACMLAVTDQLTYEARQYGVPFDSNTKPDDPDGKWDKSWRGMFGESMPGIGILYTQAHKVLTTTANSDELLIAHILAADTLPQLAARY